MNKTVLIFLASLVFLTGCARTYVITLNNRERISTRGKPRLVQGFYVFKDMSGRNTSVQAIAVHEIAPSSMASDEAGAFKPVSSK